MTLATARNASFEWGQCLYGISRSCLLCWFFAGWKGSCFFSCSRSRSRDIGTAWYCMSEYVSLHLSIHPFIHPAIDAACTHVTISWNSNDPLLSVEQTQGLFLRGSKAKTKYKWVPNTSTYYRDIDPKNPWILGLERLAVFGGALFIRACRTGPSFST